MGGAGQTEGLPDLVFQIALIREMEQYLLVDEADECRRAGRDLGDIEHLEPLALVGRRLDLGGGTGQHLIQRAGGHTGAVLDIHKVDGLKQFLVDALAGLGANEDDGGIGHEAEVLLQLFAHGVHRVAVLLDSVPLVDGDDACLALLMRVARDLRVLLGKADRGIDHDNADTAALDRGQTAQNAVALHAALHLAALAQTGGIGKDELAVLVLDHCVDGIAGGACLVGNDEAVFAQNMVDQAGLADIGAADDSNGDAVIGVLFLLLKIEVSADGVQQVTGAVAVYAGDRDQLAEAEAVKSYSSIGGSPTLSHLLTASTTGLPLRISIPATS